MDPMNEAATGKNGEPKKDNTAPYAPVNDVTPVITVAQVREKCPAANVQAMTEFRQVMARRHEDLDGFLESPGFNALPFLEQELIRAQRDSLRACLVALNLQILAVPQAEPKPEPAKD